MTTMDHAAAHERIEDLLLEPARLAALADSIEPEDIALRAHLAGCPTCSADLEGWERLQRRLTEALPHAAEAAAAAVVPVELPPSLRARVFEAAREERSAGRASDAPLLSLRIARARARRAMAMWVGLAASLIVLAGATIITVDQVARRTTAESDARALSAALAAVDRVLAVPEHRIKELRTPAGASAGSISWSRHDWIVLTTALDEPPADQRYRCWLEEGDASVAVGEMDFVGDTAYWVASLDEWATWEIRPTTRFVVSLEPADAQERTGAAVLVADLGS